MYTTDPFTAARQRHDDLVRQAQVDRQRRARRTSASSRPTRAGPVRRLAMALRGGLAPAAPAAPAPVERPACSPAG